MPNKDSKIPKDSQALAGIAHHKLIVNRTAHYSTHGTLSKKTEAIWIVTHGYGQLARNMIKRFDYLDPAKHFVIAIEGLNRFYWHENNKPAACWMTSEDRYDEIEDYVGYLDAIYARYCRHIDYRKVKINLFGFSQGCATLWRWIYAGKPHFHNIINWAGWIPEDLSYHHMSSYLGDKNIYFHYGDGDHFITEASVTDITQVINTNDLNVRI